MKLILIKLTISFYLLFGILSSAYAQLIPADTIPTNSGNIIIQPVFHGALVLQLGSKTVYIDPYNGANAYKELPKPDFVLITHQHQDHLDLSTLNELNTIQSKLIVPKAVANLLPLQYKERIVMLNNYDSVETSNITITAVPMYNLPEDSTSRHPKGRDNGYIISFGGQRIYISGDTEDIKEMRGLKNIDIAFVCMNQPFTMTVQQAASAVIDFKPKIVYPYHYRDMNGFSDITVFKKIVNEAEKKIEVRLRNWYAKTSTASKIENIIYGTASGLPLTMDVYKPINTNKIGIIAIPGTAFGYAFSSDYDQPLSSIIFSRDTLYFGKYARQLVEKGYTIFVINHRLSPTFKYKDIISDCKRAVKFIRFNADQYNINPNKIGAFGYSSGATLCAMLGVSDTIISTPKKNIDSLGSKVQCVVTLAGRFDLTDFGKPIDTIIQNPIISRVLLNYMGELPLVENGIFTLKGKYAEASPIEYVNKEDAPFLIYSSEDDPLVPHRQAVNMYNKLKNNNIEAVLVTSKREKHNPIPNIEEINNWLLKHLKN